MDSDVRAWEGTCHLVNSHSTVPNQDNCNGRYGYGGCAIGSSGNLPFSPDISVNHRIILIHDNYIHLYTNNYVFVLLNSWIFSEKTRFIILVAITVIILWDNRNF